MVTPIVSVSGGQGQEGSPGPPFEPTSATLSVIVETVCIEGSRLPDPQLCQEFPLPSPSDFTIQVLAGNPSEPFPGSSDGTLIPTEPGAYEVVVMDTPSRPQEAHTRYDRFSTDCIGSINAEETKVCTIMYTYEAGVTASPVPQSVRPLTILSAH